MPEKIKLQKIFHEKKTTDELTRYHHENHLPIIFKFTALLPQKNRKNLILELDCMSTYAIVR